MIAPALDPHSNPLTRDPQTLALTWFDANSWLIELGGCRILLDPWLIGSLTFGGQAWFFQGQRSQDWGIPADIDVILLSQGLPDHAHQPTLQQLPKSVPVVGSLSAAQVARELGFATVTALTPGEIFSWQDKVAITALPGAPLGPLVQENAYLIKDLGSHISLYYEPHGYHDPTLEQRDPVDVVLAPMVNLSILGLATILQGFQTAEKLATWLQPKVMLPTAGPGSVSYAGALLGLLQSQGGPALMQARLHKAGIPTHIVEPLPGQRIHPLQGLES